MALFLSVGHQVLGSSAARCFPGPRVESRVPGAWPLSRRERARSSGARRVWQGPFARAIVVHAEGCFESVVV